ncbi:Uncharacterized conserved protein YehS, DUF1456 family [Amphritea atlantica]|uniref:Uncharacterized conserved protein YehS, DUF1456 family n=1 Tax=Amphritea atlantica TaxID=355243 RepID=A0A1H9DIW7_9GAMM|nr:Uncharacterized conserved protein YehS, DUF1456 family [Amphritea atlantica]
MNNNDILRRLRYTFDFSDTKMIGVFRHADLAVTRVQLSGWLKREEDADYIRMPDLEMATFLNGLIVEKRGRQEGDQPVPEKRLNNNIIFRKLKIALNLTADDILAILKLAGVRLSKHELSALFRKQGHQNYRECQDQVLRNFLSGLQSQLRDKTPGAKTSKPPRTTATKSDKPVRKPSAERRAKQDVKFVVDKPAAEKTAQSTNVDSHSVWAKALAKTGKKS